MLLACITAVVIFFAFSPGAAFAADVPQNVLPVFGEGKVKVRLYTDYFCPPCRKLEPEIEPLLIDLVKKKIAGIILIDVPLHDASSLYAKHFLYAVRGHNDIVYAMAVKKSLIEAAEMNIEDPEQLRAFMSMRKFSTGSFDTKPIFDGYSDYLRRDDTASTPTCVIEKDARTTTYADRDGIVRALKQLLQ